MIKETSKKLVRGLNLLRSETHHSLWGKFLVKETTMGFPEIIVGKEGKVEFPPHPVRSTVIIVIPTYYKPEILAVR